MQVYLLDIFTLLFMILPVTIPVSIAAYSIVGEKSTHSLEPLLATPITTSELLAGKMLAAIIPAVVATWCAFLIYVIGVRFMVTSAVFARVVDPLWLIAIFIVGPLLTVVSVCAAMMISSRVSDPRAAEQISAVVILPLILIVVGQSAGLLIVDRQLVIMGAIIVFLLDIVLVFLTIKLFQRETILTSWK
jgi:ABC-2 type transport system permease protein